MYYFYYTYLLLIFNYICNKFKVIVLKLIYTVKVNIKKGVDHMLNKNEVLQIAATQLSLDYNFNSHDILNKNNIIVENNLIDGRRIYDNDGCFLKILCFNGKAFISADSQILPWCKEKLLTTDAA